MCFAMVWEMVLDVQETVFVFLVYFVTLVLKMQFLQNVLNLTIPLIRMLCNTWFFGSGEQTAQSGINQESIQCTFLVLCSHNGFTVVQTLFKVYILRNTKCRACTTQNTSMSSHISWYCMHMTYVQVLRIHYETG